jgi:hypothetical protein
MTIFDLVLILAVLGSVLTLCVLFFFLLRRQWRRARNVALALFSGVVLYAAVRVSSRAKAISQRALDAQVYLLDAKGQRFDPSAPGQQALDETGQGGQALSSELAPGGSFTRIIVFDLPRGSSHLALVVTHGQFPDLLVIGSEQSFLHKPTIIELRLDG